MNVLVVGPPAWNRLLAFLIDLLCVLAWAAVLAAIGVPLYSIRLLPNLNGVLGNVVSFLVLVAPVTVVLARSESGAREGTIGKRARRLQVVDVATGSRVSFWRALLRNALKLAVPWGIGHLAVYGLIGTSSSGSVPTWLKVVTGAAYLLPAVYVISLFVRQGRTPYDWISRTIVMSDHGCTGLLTDG